MDALKRLTKVFKSSPEIPFDDSSKIIIMSDCHRGDGSWSDDFSRNQHLFFGALKYYYKNDYTYIELGDGDELWENRDFSEIISMYSDVFWLLSKFFKKGRLHFVFGNHDMVKKDPRFVRRNMYYYFDERLKKHIPLFTNIKIHEGIVLKHRQTRDKIFLTHGHQVDFLNNELWKLARFLVRYLWRPLELFGVKNPMRTAKNHKKKESVAKKLSQWVKKERHMLIAGHNHRAMFPEVGDTPYFNDGSCVHPRCITGIEIIGEYIMLIKWCTKAKDDGTLFVDREVLAGPRKLDDYFTRLQMTNQGLTSI